MLEELYIVTLGLWPWPQYTRLYLSFPVIYSQGSQIMREIQVSSWKQHATSPPANVLYTC